MRSVSFFASTTVLIIAGLIAVLGARERAMAVLADLPFAAASSTLLWDLKVLLLIVLFVYALFKFTWVFGQYNYCLILVGCAPAPGLLSAESLRIADRRAHHQLDRPPLQRGIRVYHFGLAALIWFIHPWLFILLTAWAVLVLYAASSTHACCARSRSRPKKKPRSFHPNRERRRKVEI
jgi:uncharacterized membrane protein